MTNISKQNSTQQIFNIWNVILLACVWVNASQKNIRTNVIREEGKKKKAIKETKKYINYYIECQTYRISLNPRNKWQKYIAQPRFETFLSISAMRIIVIIIIVIVLVNYYL